MILRIVETPSCNRKNAKVRGHTDFKDALSMVEVPSYTREKKTTTTVYPQFEIIEDVPTSHAIGLRTLKTT